MSENVIHGVWLGQIVAKFKQQYNCSPSSSELQFLVDNYEYLHLYDDNTVIKEAKNAS